MRERQHFTFDGARIDYRAGQTVAAALIGAGILSWRTTRLAGKPRGLLCGIGICFDCLITVDGLPNQRACLLAARSGTAVTTQIGTGHHELG